MDIPMLLEIPAAIVPDDVAAVDAGGPVTYAELCGRANAVSEALLGAGLPECGRVLVLSVNSVAHLAALFGIAAAGGVGVPVNYRVHEDELAYLLADAEVDVVLAQPRYLALATAAGAGFDGLAILDLDAVAGADGAVAGELIRRREIPDGSTATVLYTSGTTSAPKGVMLAHTGLSSYVMTANDAADGTPQGRSLLSAPLYHVAGLAAMLNALYVGRATVLQPQFDAAGWLAAVEDEGITHAFVVPTMLARVVDHPDFRPERVASLQVLTYGAAPMPPSLIRRVIDVFPEGVRFSGAYGQTETSSTVAVLGPDDHDLTVGDPDLVALRRRRLSSVGKVVDDVEVRIVDPAGSVLGPDVEGEVQLRTERAMTGYWGGASEATRVSVDADGWMSTGDLGHLDADGYLFLGGRRGDLIIRGGQNVAPEEVEAIVHEHPDVADVAVVGIADDEWGERIAAVVVRREGSAVGEDELLRFCADRTSADRRPEVVLFTDELPRNAMGKLVRRALLPLLGERLPGATAG
jgi:acyl-CoA synthetase (AMP-forming)/AMP-acid ligase II